MKLHEYQIEDARAMMEEFAGLDGQCYDENSRALIKRFVEMVEGWMLNDQRERFNGVDPTPPALTPGQEMAGMRINPYGDQS